MNKDLKILWDDCLQILRSELTESAFNLWFKPIQPLSFADGTLVLQIPSQTVIGYIEENFIQQYARAIFRTFGAGTRVEYRVLIDSQSGLSASAVSDGLQVEKMRHEALVVNHPSQPAFQQPAAPQLPPIDSRLNPNYTFETFVQGECNKLVRTVSLSAARQPGVSTFNPLFIYGGSGVGKTHLMNAIGNLVKQIYPDKRVLYLSANEFKTQFMDAGQRGQVANFMQFYQTIDVLLIDDVQFLAGPNQQKTQEQFFHIFNYLQQSQKQIVMTSDRSPMDIKDLEDRLITRFRWGFQGEMLRPDYSLRKDILKNKMLRDGIDLSDEVVSFIAENIRDNVRNLEGVLASLLAYSMVMGQDIDIRLAEKVVEQVAPPAAEETQIDDIVDLVSTEFGVPTASLMSKSRLQTVATARMAAMYLARLLTDRSLVEIGKYFDRTHATVLHAIDAASDLEQTNPVFKRQLAKIKNQLLK